jgi:hypothetical protein
VIALCSADLQIGVMDAEALELFGQVRAMT